MTGPGTIPLVAASRRGNDSARIQQLLAAAQGYSVFGREGKRVGSFIGLAGRGEQQIAIRHDGTFVWRRRVLPITVVASVFPRERAILLDVDRHSVAQSDTEPDEAIVETPLAAERRAVSSEQVQKRVAHYLAYGRMAADEPERFHASEPAQPPAERTALDRHWASGHLVFISTSRGYALFELEGSPPARGETIEFPEQPGSFQVAKLAPSPLPNDPRICAFLERASW